MGRGQANGRDPSQQHGTEGLYQIGIYGWRKRCLYLFILLLTVLLIINLSLTIWILKVMDFSIYGMGNLRMTADGIRVNGDAEFLKPVYATHIKSQSGQALTLESSRNITIQARDRNGQVTNRFFIGEKSVESLCQKFEVKSDDGSDLFYADKNGVVIGAERLKIAGSGGATFAGSVQTRKVVAHPGEELHLQSPTRSIHISAPQNIRLTSPAGDIRITGLNVILQARNNAILVNASNIVMKNLPISRPVAGGQLYPGVYQLCICSENGRLFLAEPNSNCSANIDVCGTN